MQTNLQCKNLHLEKYLLYLDKCILFLKQKDARNKKRNYDSQGA